MRVDNLTNFMAKLEAPVAVGFGEENPHTVSRAFESIVEKFRALLQTPSGSLGQQVEMSSLPVSLTRQGTPISLPPKQCSPAWSIPFTPTPGRQEISSFITFEDWDPKTGKSSSFMSSDQPEAAAIAFERPVEAPVEMPNKEESPVETGVWISSSGQTIHAKPVGTAAEGYARYVDVIPENADPLAEGALKTSRQSPDAIIGSHNESLDVRAQQARAEAREQKKREESLWTGVAIAFENNAKISRLVPSHKSEGSGMLETSRESVRVPASPVGLFPLAPTPGTMASRLSFEQVKLPANAPADEKIAGIIASPDRTQENGLRSTEGASTASEREAKQFPGSSTESFSIETTGKQPAMSPIEHQPRASESALPGTQSVAASERSSPSFEPLPQVAAELAKLSGEPLVSEPSLHSLASSSDGQSSGPGGRLKGDTNETSKDWERRMFAGPIGPKEEIAPASKLDGAEQGLASSHEKQNRPDTPTTGQGAKQVAEAQGINVREETDRAMANRVFQWNNIPAATHAPQAGAGGTPHVQQAPPGTATNAPEFIMQLGDRIRVQIQKGDGEIRLQLSPENLGHLDIKAENGSAGLIARITTESGSVKHYLENNLHMLQQSMLDQGLKVERIDVVLQDGLEAHNFAHQHNSHHTGQQREEPRHLSDPQPASGMTNTESTSSDSGNVSHSHHHRGFHTVA